MTIPWGVFQWVVEHPELGWVLLFLWLLFELRSDRGRIYQLDKKITGSIIVIRALARSERAIDEDKVDEYLVDNGMEPEDFFKRGETNSVQKMVEDDVDDRTSTSLGNRNNTPNKDEHTTE